jgi:hypothetical protein
MRRHQARLLTDFAARIDMKKLFLVALFLAPRLLMAQAYSGVATSISGKPLPYATVTVCSGQSDVLIQNSQQSCNGQAALNPPSNPTLTAVSGAAPPAGTYKVVITYVNGVGETIGSVPTSITTSGGNLNIQVTSPPAYSNATGWNAYFTVASGTVFYLQNSSPIAIGTNYTQTVAISTAAFNPPVGTTATNAILPLAIIYGNVEQTVALSNPVSADGNGRYTLFAPAGSYTVSISSPGYVTYSAPFTVPANVSGNIAFTGNNTHSGTETFSGGGTVPVDPSGLGVSCASVDSTSAYQAVITAQSAVPGATILEPPGCLAKVSALTANSVDFLNFEGGGGQFGPTYSLDFTGTCASAACFQTKDAADFRARNIVLGFPNCTTTPCWETRNSTGGARNSFHHVGIAGPGITGPTLMDLESMTFAVFDDWSWCVTVATCFNGSISGSTSDLSDNVSFRNFTAYNIGTSVFRNLAVTDTIQDSSLNLCNSSNQYAKALDYSGFVGMQSLLIMNTAVVGGPGSGCNNAISFWNTPNVTAGSGFGAVTVIGGITIGGGAQTAFTFGNNNAAKVSGHDFANLAVGIVVGTGVTLDVDTPICQGTVTTFLSGTPVRGRVEDCSGNTTHYGPNFFPIPPVATGTPAGISGSGPCASIALPASGSYGGSWAGGFKCTGTTGATSTTITTGFANTLGSGWTCDFHDITAGTTLPQTSYNQTSCSFGGTVNSNDVITWRATPW